MTTDFIYLASASPRRRELLAQIGVPFRVLASNVREVRRADERPEAYVERVAKHDVVTVLLRQTRTKGRPRAPAVLCSRDTHGPIHGHANLIANGWDYPGCLGVFFIDRDWESKESRDVWL